MAWRLLASFWLGVLLTLVCGEVHASVPLVIDDAISQVQLSPHISYYHDASGAESVDTVMQRVQQGRFQPLPSGRSSFGFHDGGYWFHLRVINLNDSEPRWLLVQQYALSDRIDVYTRRPDGRSTHQRGGDSVPFDERSISYRHPNFWLTLPQGQAVDVFVRVQSQSSMQVPLSLYTPTAFTEMARDAQL
ncbi:MAG: 7TMR-DISMED2 domain-containing protein, partial [Lysobacter sp.]